MNNGFIAVIDSGIGGLSVLAETVKALPCERYIYFGDAENAPYGNKSERELYEITVRNFDRLFRYGLKAVIFGCNTLSVSVLPVVAPRYGIPFFGVYPPIKEAEGKAVLFSTPVTAKAFKNSENLTVIPLARLATDVENNKYNLNKVDIKNHLKGNNFYEGVKSGAIRGEDYTVILGCTHYLFVKNQFINHFCPRKVISGNEIAAQRAKFCLTQNGLLSNYQDFTVEFIGKSAEENFKFYNSVVKDVFLLN